MKQTQPFELNIVPRGAPQIVHVCQYDTGARAFSATIYDDTGVMDLSGVTKIEVSGTRSNKAGFVRDDIATIDTDTSTVTWDCVPAMTATAGKVICGLAFYDADGNRIGTANFVLMVQPAALPAENVTESPDFGAIITDAVKDYLDDKGVIADITYSTRTSEGVLWGDANNDGVVDNADGILVDKYIVELVGDESVNVAACDLDGDGKVTNADAIILKRLITNKGDDQIIIKTIITYQDKTKRTIWGLADASIASGGGGTESGEPGVGIYDIAFKESAASGNVYTITLTNGRTYDITAPSYTLPVATSTKLGGVKPVARTNEMTEPVGVDADGKLWGKPPGAGASGSGQAGEDGGYYTPSVDANGNLTWTASKSGMPSVASSNIKGSQGAVGATPNLTIGEVETLAAGLPATASITGTAANPVLNLGIPKGADGADGEGGSGSAGESVLLGQTPLKLTSDASTLILSADGECTFELQSDTIADFDILNGTPVNATITQEGNLYKLQASSGASAWYSSYIDSIISGLTVGTKYNLVVDASGGTFDAESHVTTGHYILYDVNNGTLATRGAMDGVGLYSYEFTATTESVRLRWYPANNSYFQAGASVAMINRAYIDREGATAHTDIMSLSGSFTGSTTLRAVPKGVTVSSSPSCYVYSKAASDTESAKLLTGKTIVCFGDSLFGMYRGETSAPAAVEEVTGATVYNVGFGGCRMSDHPTSGYAAFSMWALAYAIANDDWTTQDAQASNGSNYFPDQLAILKSIDFNTVDAVVIHYGTNDFGGGVAIGADSAASIHSTLCGAMRYSIETLLKAYPKLRIYISLPVFRFWTSNGVTTYSDAYTNSQNKTLIDYIEAMRDVAKEYNLPIIDGYYGLGINKVNAATYLGDGTHHNEAGRKRFGTFIGAQIMANM